MSKVFSTHYYINILSLLIIYYNKLNEFTYKNGRRLAYDIGTWFVAFLIHNEGESTLKDGFYGDLDKYGFVKSFERNFGKSPSAYILEFNTFLENNRNNTKAFENLLQNALLVRGNEAN